MIRDMKEFYKKHALSASEFARMLNVGDMTLKKYTNGESIKECAARKIDIGIRIVEEKGLVRPVVKDYSTFAAHNIAVCKYKDDFKEMLKEELCSED